MSERLTHLDDGGQAQMVDVSVKDVTVREAAASARVRLSAAAVTALRDNTVPKGDALAVARIAGIMGAKRTPDLIPLCHPIALHSVTVDLSVTDDGVTITARARTADRTGVEMEALTSVTVGGAPPGPQLMAELEEALWSSLHPDERLQRDKIGVVKRPGQDAERSESLALAQLLIVSHLVGAFDGAFEL